MWIWSANISNSGITNELYSEKTVTSVSQSFTTNVIFYVKLLTENYEAIYIYGKACVTQWIPGHKIQHIEIRDTAKPLI